jgi:hypothetical protein
MPTFDLAKFRILFPQFNSVSDEVVTAVAEQATCYISSACTGNCAVELLNLMVAHLLALREQIASGAGKALTGASMGGVSVSLAQPAKADDRKSWLFMTPFGQQYLALESKCVKGQAAAGLYFSYLPEGKGFRKIGGGF